MGRPPRDHAIARCAGSQHGVIALRQLAALGLTADAARKRVATGRLHRVHAGVYAVVPPALLTRTGRVMAAVLAGAPGTAASHRAAAALLDLGLRGHGLADVTTPGSASYRRPGIHVHSGATLLPRDIVRVDGIPCTTLARTLLDVAGDASRRELERACDRAATRGDLDMRAIDDVLGRAGGRRGAGLLRSVLSDHRAGSTLTRNDLEEAFLAIARDIGLPPDAVNRWIPYPQGGGAEADFVYERHRLIVEVDGRDPHTTRKAFEQDRRRDQQLMLLGWRVVRFTWRQVMHEPAGVAATLRALMAP